MPVVTPDTGGLALGIDGERALSSPRWTPWYVAHMGLAKLLLPSPASAALLSPPIILFCYHLPLYTHWIWTNHRRGPNLIYLDAQPLPPYPRAAGADRRPSLPARCRRRTPAPHYPRTAGAGPPPLTTRTLPAPDPPPPPPLTTHALPPPAGRPSIPTRYRRRPLPTRALPPPSSATPPRLSSSSVAQPASSFRVAGDLSSLPPQPSPPPGAPRGPPLHPARGCVNLLELRRPPPDLHQSSATELTPPSPRNHRRRYLLPAPRRRPGTQRAAAPLILLPGSACNSSADTNGLPFLSPFGSRSSNCWPAVPPSEDRGDGHNSLMVIMLVRNLPSARQP
ncbi:formin-like protein 5 [Triticum aestivum]|uniref:formin-like protein 5 n=1 Tax=Triticum aestivum TaxID=4565 RepID=UPI001D0293F0|nr:formin-like protein 5 [Triticum aestivum]